MTYTVFTYKCGVEQSRESFSNIQLAFNYMGHLDLVKTDVESCLLDDGTDILIKLKRDENGYLSPIKDPEKS